MELLHSAIQFDLKSMEMRWSVTVLLHKIGKKDEGIKTWCKTRGINVHQPLNKVLFIQTKSVFKILVVY